MRPRGSASAHRHTRTAAGPAAPSLTCGAPRCPRCASGFQPPGESPAAGLSYSATAASSPRELPPNPALPVQHGVVAFQGSCHEAVLVTFQALNARPHLLPVLLLKATLPRLIQV